MTFKQFVQVVDSNKEYYVKLTPQNVYVLDLYRSGTDKGVASIDKYNTAGVIRTMSLIEEPVLSAIDKFTDTPVKDREYPPYILNPYKYEYQKYTKRLHGLATNACNQFLHIARTKENDDIGESLHSIISNMYEIKSLTDLKKNEKDDK